MDFFEFQEREKWFWRGVDFLLYVLIERKVWPCFHVQWYHMKPSLRS